MKIETVAAVSFSPTGGTRRSTSLVSHAIADALGCGVREVDVTGPEQRKTTYHFPKNELLVVGMPIYAGRLPNKIAPDLAALLHGDGTPAVLVLSYGNRSPGDGAAELQQILERNGFLPMGAAAIATRHPFSDKIAVDRPDEDDKAAIGEWCMRLVRKLTAERAEPLPPVERALAPYYVPLGKDGTPANFLRAKPKTNAALCDNCGLCVRVCPMGSIRPEDCSQVAGVCIKCQSCVRRCPRGAKYFDDERFLSHVAMLERDYMAKAENTFIV
ncbi:MAG: 4Fe-4S binding protein [Clostridiales bacterium]|nr:4Fe-4S binding protein [Clostridiales bacterium]